MSSKILIVEDQLVIAADWEARLLELGYQVVGTAPNSRDAMELFNRHTPDLVIMDIDLRSQPDGIETARLMRLQRPVPIIFLTGNSDNFHFKKASRVRPNAFLSKPIRTKDLRYAIELALPDNVQAPLNSSKEHKATPAVTLAPEESARVIDNHIYVRTQNKTVRIDLSKISWVMADNYYCQAVIGKSKVLLTMTLKKFQQSLPVDTLLFRCHRSLLINTSQIAELGQNYVIIQGAKLPVSRQHLQALRSIIAG